MIDADASDVHKLGQIVLVRHVVSMPSHDIEGGVVLGALEELAAELVDNFPGRLLDFIVGNWV